ncbi:RlpA-like protein precursor [Blastochloris viridis]|uniref:Endolytic peptidoglycan transglycosylase RlpA n=2 Tax=Blastochloris viridis TaxID=1079 RepID=A0A0H5BJQ3_BLAVI|nr:septal ring lytic transglycosylase RlpA family protein [Blastochloris viridis]ALK09408.1 RlpA-like protein precursor [Blastochloris viridis]BAS00712.1 rare lipoprotein A precursor [Blastochloris viridis]CUU42071.1 RlpA-like protein precursor [Blastochloris viridis]
MELSARTGCRIATLGAAALILSACSLQERLASRVDPKYGVSASPKVVADGQPIPKGGGTFRTGKPYTIAGKTFVPLDKPQGFREEGVASWYGDDFHGRLTANGEVYDMHSVSAAHPTLPIPSFARVTNLSNRRSIVVRINDRGPFHGNRVIDLSVKTAQALDFHRNGVAKVRVEYVGPASLDGTDDKVLLATLRTDGQPAPSPSPVMVASAAPFVPPVSAYSSASMPPSASTRVAIRGSVPLPPDRPFDVGPSEHPLTSSGLRTSSRPMTTASTTAFAPIEASGANGAVATGRGLY